jgi:hypothetical protein
MSVLEFRDIADLLNQSRTTQLETKALRSKDGRWAIYDGAHTVHTSVYRFLVLYLYAAATLEDIREAVRFLDGSTPAHIVHAPSIGKLVASAQDQGLLSRFEKSVWSTKDYMISFFKDELETYLKQIKTLSPSNYTNPKVHTPRHLTRKTPNPVLGFLVDDMEDRAIGKLGILLAEPGQGKTYMSRYLVSRLAGGDFGVVPLMVDSSQWQGLSISDQKSLTKTIAHSFRHFGASIGWVDGHEELFLKATLKAEIFRIVFDGFDEYVLHNRGTIQGMDVLEALADLAETTGARIVITSRTSFWNTNLPQDEVESFVQTRGAYVYSILPFDRESAKNYFDQRITSEDARGKAIRTYDALKSDSEDLVGRGFVLSLIADLAERGEAVSRQGRGATQGVLWLVEALCQRETLRQEIPFTAKEQMAALRDLSLEMAVGEKATTELLAFILSYVRPTLDARSTNGTVDKLMSHPLLSRNPDTDLWSFKQEQIQIVLLADQVIANPTSAARLARKANLEPGVRQDLADMIVQLARHNRTREEAFQVLMELIKLMMPEVSALDSPERTASSGSKFVAVVALTTIEQTMAGSDRAERAERLVHLVDTEAITNLTFTGTIARYDFTGVEFRNCGFERTNWVNCLFNEKTRFFNCEFTGGTVPTRCDGLGTVTLDECKFDPEAEAIFNLARIEAGKRRYSKEDLLEDIKSVIDKFVVRGGVGLKSVQERNLTRGTIASSRHKKQIVQSITAQVLEAHQISGAGHGFHIRSTAVDAVHFYATNNVLTGPLADVLQRLEREIGL